MRELHAHTARRSGAADGVRSRSAAAAGGRGCPRRGRRRRHSGSGPGSSPRCWRSTTSCGAAAAPSTRWIASSATSSKPAARRTAAPSGCCSRPSSSRPHSRRSNAGLADSGADRRARAADAPAVVGRLRRPIATSSSRSPIRPPEPRGLWPADFDLLSRLPGLERIDVVATEGVLAAGWHERLHDAMPEMDETRVADGVRAAAVRRRRRPTLSEDPAAVFVCRDREEELVEAARRIKRRARETRRSDPSPGAHRHRLPAAAAVPLSGAAGASAPRRFRIRLATRCRWPPSRSPPPSISSSSWRPRTHPRDAVIGLLTSPHWRLPRAGRAWRTAVAVGYCRRSIACCRNCDSSAAGRSWRTCRVAGHASARRRHVRLSMWRRAECAMRAALALAPAVRAHRRRLSVAAQIDAAARVHRHVRTSAPAWRLGRESAICGRARRSSARSPRCETRTPATTIGRCRSAELWRDRPPMD